MRQRGESAGLIWFDAHADMNTPETTPSGNVHGMPLAYALGLGSGVLASLVEPEPLIAVRNAVIVGVRDLDAGERELIERAGLRVITMRQIDERGIRAAVETALEIATDGTAASTSAWIWTSSTRARPRAWERRAAAARPTARRTWRWR